MTRMPRPTKVWMVPLGRTPIVEVMGDLRLEEGALRFQPREEGAPATHLGFETITKVRRVRGSPVLMITHTEGSPGAKTQTAFYFTQPPALDNIVRSRTAAEPEDVDLRSMRPSAFGQRRSRSKRRTVRTNATYLTQEGTSRRHELQTWVEEIRKELRGT